MKDKIASLLQLAHEIGREDRPLAILTEGNVSIKISADKFATKTTGASLGALTEAGVAVCDASRILPLLEKKNLNDDALDQALHEARAEGQGARPSPEALFHAWLLGLDGVQCAAHCSPLPVNQILCSPRAREFAERRLFPEEIVHCGPSSLFIPYSNPGWILAREIRDRTNAYLQQHGKPPRLILLQNNGILALGTAPEAVLSCLLMAVKSAAVFIGAAALGGPNFMTQPQVERIAARFDETNRQRQLNL